MEYDDFARRKYGPVGRCIYCGSTDDLGDEHILPPGRPQPVAFARMIGKIAYAYAVAELGLDVFQEAGIVPAIRGDEQGGYTLPDAPAPNLRRTRRT